MAVVIYVFLTDCIEAISNYMFHICSRGTTYVPKAVAGHLHYSSQVVANVNVFVIMFCHGSTISPGWCGLASSDKAEVLVQMGTDMSLLH